MAIVSFPHPNLLLLGQNGVTLLLLMLGMKVAPSTFATPPPVNAQVAGRWLPLVCLFVCMLTSSLLALKYVTAVTLIVLRNLTSLVVAALEYFYLGAAVSAVALASLIGMLFGAVLYGYNDVYVSSSGYFWLFVNVVSTSAFQVHNQLLLWFQIACMHSQMPFLRVRRY